jgi:hypothetical protein
MAERVVACLGLALATHYNAFKKVASWVVLPVVFSFFSARYRQDGAFPAGLPVFFALADGSETRKYRQDGAFPAGLPVFFALADGSETRKYRQDGALLVVLSVLSPRRTGR